MAPACGRPAAHAMHAHGRMRAPAAIMRPPSNEVRSDVTLIDMMQLLHALSAAASGAAPLWNGITLPEQWPPDLELNRCVLAINAYVYFDELASMRHDSEHAGRSVHVRTWTLSPLRGPSDSPQIQSRHCNVSYMCWPPLPPPPSPISPRMAGMSSHVGTTPTLTHHATQRS